ncbi:hypothetical protein LI291_04640 [Intestinibacillus massiliensis]|nr:hypothetical protein [Intestinibacillus massiliensis]
MKPRKRTPSARSNAAKRIAASALAVCVSLSPYLPAAGALEPSHSEALYVTLSPDGTPQESSIVKTYLRNGADSVTDYGDYDEIINMTDYTEPDRGDGSVTFHFTDDTPARFYFEGKTSVPVSGLPWSLKIGYKLNGVPKEAAELAGQQGLVEITVDATPNPEADPYFRNNMILQAATIIDADDALSIEAPGAQVQSIGSMTAVVFMALPGETQTFTLRIGSDDFSFSGLYFLMVPATLSQLDQIADLREVKDKVEDSGEAINDSLDVLLSTMGAMQGSLHATAYGLDALDQARRIIASGKGGVYDSADSALSSLDAVNAALEPVNGHLSVAQNALEDTKKQMDTMVQTALGLKSQLSDTRHSIEKTQKDVEKLQDMLKDLKKQDGYRKDVADDLGDDLRVLGDQFDVLSWSLDSLRKYLGSPPEISDVGSVNLDDLVVDGQTVGQIKTAVAALQQAYTQAYAQAQAQAGDAFDETAFNKGFADSLSPEQKKLWGMMQDGSLEQQLKDAEEQVGTVNGVIGGVNSKLDEVNGIVGDLYSPLASVVSSLSNVCELLGQDDKHSITQRLWELNDTLNSYLDVVAKYNGDISDLAGQLNEMGTVASQVTDIADDLLDQLDGLDKTLNDYEPDAQQALEDAKTFTDAARGGITDANAFLTRFRDLLEKSGKQLNTGTEKTLDGLIDALNQAADGLGQTGVIQNAKDTVKDLIDDEWDSHTGEDNNLLNMDAGATPISFTSERNPAPTSLQVILRTDAIKVDDDKDAVSRDEDFHAEGNFLTRLGNVLKEIWRAICSLFN